MTHDAGTLPSGFKRAVFKTAYELTKKRFWLLAWLLTIATLPQIFNILIAVVEGVIEAVARSGGEEPSFGVFSIVAGLISLACSLLSIPFMAGFYWASLRLVRGEEATLGDVLSQLRHFWSYLFGGILYALGVLGGLLLLIVPGLIWAVKWSFYQFPIMDEGLKAGAALKRSGDLTRGAKWQVFGFFLLLLALNVAGLLAFVVGLLFTVPMSYVAMAVFYDKLKLRATLLTPNLVVEG